MNKKILEKILIACCVYLSLFGLYLTFESLQSNIIIEITQQKDADSLGLISPLVVSAAGIIPILWWLKEKD